MPENTKNRTLALASRSSRAVAARGSLVKRGLEELALCRPQHVDWTKPTIVGSCLLEQCFDYQPHSSGSLKNIVINCNVTNLRDYGQAPGKLTIFVRSRINGQITKVDHAFMCAPRVGSPHDAPYQVCYIDVESGCVDRRVWLWLGKSFARSKPNTKCVEEIIGDATEILAHDDTLKIVIVVTIKAG